MVQFAVKLESALPIVAAAETLALKEDFELNV